MKKRSLLVLALTLIVLIFALVTGFPLLMRLFYVLTLAIAGGYLWAWLNLRWLEAHIERRTQRVHVGQPVEERITVRNTSFLPKPWLEVTDLTDIPGHYTGQVVGLTGRGFRSWRTRTLARRRGVFTLGPLRIATGDPFGVFRLERSYHGQQQVIVLPAVVPITRFFVPSADLTGDGQLRLRSQQVSPHVASVRDYLAGDSLSRIHWPSTARQGRLMVKEFDLGLTSDIWVLLDMEAAAHAAQGEETTEELAVTAAASLARYFLGRRLPVGFAASGADFSLLPPDSHGIQDGRILDLLSRAQANGDVSLVQAVARLDSLLTRHTTLVVVTPSAEPSWLEAMGVLGQRGVRLAAVLVDATSFGGADTSALAPLLRTLGVAPYVVGKGDNLAAALDHPVALHWDARVGVAVAPGGRA
ncbi:MAG: DUF58 domain-containing protein [Chloroflexi bacterium]|nr:DUF58 domain-containing protein [Chloroflexota bacterium]